MKARLSLKARAFQLLAQREHSRLELRRKLLDHARVLSAAREPEAAPARRLPPTPEMLASVDELLGWLQANEHLSEARFVEARLRSRAPRQGNLRIRHELGQHGLKLAPADEQALKDSEFARAQTVWSRKFDGAAADAAGRARQARFLAGRGFSAEVIRRLLRGDD